jgi:hypothetical protein
MLSSKAEAVKRTFYKHILRLRAQHDASLDLRDGWLILGDRCPGRVRAQHSQMPKRPQGNNDKNARKQMQCAHHCSCTGNAKPVDSNSGEQRPKKGADHGCEREASSDGRIDAVTAQAFVDGQQICHPWLQYAQQTPPESTRYHDWVGRQRRLRIAWEQRRRRPDEQVSACLEDNKHEEHGQLADARNGCEEPCRGPNTQRAVTTTSAREVDENAVGGRAGLPNATMPTTMATVHKIPYVAVRAGTMSYGGAPSQALVIEPIKLTSP